MLLRAYNILHISLLAGVLVLLSVGNVFADITVEAGESFVLSADESLTIDGSVIIAAAGTLDVSANNTSVSFTDDWSNAGTFTPGTTSTVSVTDAGVVSDISGNTSFNNFSCVVPNKRINFAAGSTQGIAATGALTLDGQAKGTRIMLRSSAAGTRWNFDVASEQSVDFVDVQDGEALTSNIEAVGSTDSGNNDNAEAAPHWIFAGGAIIDSAAGSETVGRTPTIIGRTTDPNTDFTITGIIGGTEVVVVSGTSDKNGNFRVAVDAAALADLGANTLSPYVRTVGEPGIGVALPGAGFTLGLAKNVNVVVNPTPSQVPTIDTPVMDAQLSSKRFSVSGKARPGLEVRLQAWSRDAAGDKVLQLDCADVSGAKVYADAVTGDYTIDCDALAQNLLARDNVLSVTMYDGAGNAVTTSAMRGVQFTDPYGIVFDSVSNNPISGAVVTLYYDNDPAAGRSWISAVPGVHILPAESNPQTAAADGFYSYNTINGDFRIEISATGYAYPSTLSSFPAGRVIVTGSKGEVFTVAGVVIEMDHPMDTAASQLRIEKEANKKEVVVGDVVTYTVTIENPSATDAVGGVFIEDKIPAGFKYLSGKAILDGKRIADPTGNRPLVFDIGTVSGGQTLSLKYQLVVGSGVSFGSYENKAFARLVNSGPISNYATESVEVVADPLFDLGTVIGKVFHDRNENGIQDKGEEPVGAVQIVTEDGAVITTDRHGRYHLAAVMPGRHLFRLDERSLPEGAWLTTKKVVIVDVSPGILRKVNFGVKLADRADAVQQPFVISQDRGKPVPRLNVSLLNDELVVRDGKLAERGEFRIFSNYSLFIQGWLLEILDRATDRVVEAIEGTGGGVFDPIYLSPLRHGSLRWDMDKDYVYRLRVWSADGAQDVTAARELKLVEKSSIGSDEQYAQWLYRESRRSGMESQSIRVEGETLRVSGFSFEPLSVRVLRSGKLIAEVPVIEGRGASAKDLLEAESADGSSEVEIILPRAEYDLQVRQGRRSASAEGTRSYETHSKHVSVGEDYFFLVAMGDGKVGYNFNRGNMEPVGADERFREGFWKEGRVAYYLKGRVKGKYLITSSFDTERGKTEGGKKELFRNLDPDKYYPVYGDDSSVNYSATDTMGMLYLLIEWDNSSILWGNYNTEFTDTELAQYSRTFFGGKVHLQTLSSTKFGEPHSKLVVFKAMARQKAAHNEFRGTGGSLFYLKHKEVIEGSDKVRIELRDKITGLVLAVEDMKEGSDYEIDYSNGRIVFWRPVSQIAESNLIISTHLLNGNPVYVIVDYEYEVKDILNEGTVGARVQQSITDYVSLGGTYIDEEQDGQSYELKAADATLHLGDSIELRGEYAESKSEAMGSFISTDGGLSFTELATEQSARGKAYGVKASVHLFEEKLGLSSYYTWIGKGFSTAATTSQQGKQLMGAAVSVDITEKARVSASHDIQELIDDGNAQSELQVGAQRTETTTVQAAYGNDEDRLRVTTEYRHQSVVGRKEEYNSETNSEGDMFAARVDYRVTDDIDLFVEEQLTMSWFSVKWNFPILK